MAKEIDNRERLIFAMDVPDCNQARQLVETLDDSVVFFKLGLELMMTDGYFDLMDWMLKRNKKIFADLKFFDIPATVGAAVNRLQNTGASFVTVHGNQAIMEAAATNKGKHLKVLAVTALTSLDRGDLDDMGFVCDIGDLVLSRAKRALEAGCDGVVSSGLEVPELRKNIDSQLLVVTPGIRPVDNKESEDQKRVVTVAKAFKNGADYIVVGRPIRDADNPRNAAEEIQSSISECF
jgi:orotidine-5'-phosphate decarboxylase